MDPRLQRRVQRYGWDRAAAAYEEGWQAQLAPAHDLMLDMVALRPGERVLDVACGTGLVTLRVGAGGRTGGRGRRHGHLRRDGRGGRARRPARRPGARCGFERADAEELPFADGGFDAALCGLGLMYVPDPVRALARDAPGAAARRPGGRGRVGRAARLRLGRDLPDHRRPRRLRRLPDVLPSRHRGHAGARLRGGGLRRRSGRAHHDDRSHYASADEALAAVFRGGPVALAYSRFDDADQTGRSMPNTSIPSPPTRSGDGYRIPGEFVVAAARSSMPQTTARQGARTCTHLRRRVDNGVNVAALLGAREALTAAPEAAHFHWRATCKWMNGTHSRSTVEGFFGLGQDQRHKTEFTFDADHPEIFASEDNGATPVEYVLVGLGACLTAGIAAVAQHRNIQLRSVSATLEGAMDIQGILGIDSDVRNGFDGIKVTYEIDADATPDEIKALVAQSQKRSAVFDIVTNPTNVTVEVK